MAEPGSDAAPPVGPVLRRNGPVLTYRSILDDGTAVVVKRVAETAAPDPIGRRRFEREGRFARLLSHPSLPRLVAAGRGWIALEALRGTLCEPAMADRFRNPAAARSLLASLGEALSFVHARGVVHRDLKPAHVMFRAATPVLIDFGIAGVPGDDLDGEELSGTAGWMAPEQLAGAVGPPADIWSLSALGLFLLTGLPPYGGSAEDVLRRRAGGEVPAFLASQGTDCGDPSLVAFLLRGLGAPAERPSAADFARLTAVR